MMNKVQIFQLQGAICKVREPDKVTSKTPVILLFHGYSGDESSMWTFGAQIPEEALVISIRAPYTSKDIGIGGYTWVNQPIGYWPTYQDFFPAVEFLKHQISELSTKFPSANFDQLSVVGFSQGGAMASVFANAYPGSIEKLAILSGFLPDLSDGYMSSEKFSRMKVFIAHGNKDEMVSIELARNASKVLSNLGAAVTYCEGDVGHQLDSSCFQAFGKFLSGE